MATAFCNAQPASRGGAWMHQIGHEHHGPQPSSLTHLTTRTSSQTAQAGTTDCSRAALCRGKGFNAKGPTVPAATSAMHGSILCIHCSILLLAARASLPLPNTTLARVTLADVVATRPLNMCCCHWWKMSQASESQSRWLATCSASRKKQGSQHQKCSSGHSGKHLV